MEAVSPLKEDRQERPQDEGGDRTSRIPLLSRDSTVYTIYALAIAASVSLWLLPIQSPLRLDELGTYWQIMAGVSQIWARHFVTLSSPEHAFILWLSTKTFGTSEIALRIPSILAMLGAVYVLYLAARELFERDVAIVAAIVFALHPIVIFESIDARPYAFAALATSTAILVLLRLRRSNSGWLAALFGLSAASIVWFQFLFVDILPALVLCFFVIKARDPKTLWRQFAIAFATFTFACLPVIPIMLYLFRTSKTHVYETAPNLSDLALTLAPGWHLIALCITCFVALLVSALSRRPSFLGPFHGWQLIVCASLAFIPISILFGVSVGTSLHIFTTCHRMDAIPGIALCWALLLSRLRNRNLRLLFSIALVAVTSVTLLEARRPNTSVHGYAWKYALEYVQRNASADNAPVVICSDFPEADYVTMPLDSAKESKLFAQLSYYKLSVPVVPLPRALNDEAVRVGSSFLHEAAQKHERFLALANEPSYKTLDWLAQNSAATYSVRKLGVFDGVEVLEFVPRSTTKD